MAGFSKSVEHIDELKAMLVSRSATGLKDDVAKDMAIEIAGYVHVAKDAKSSAIKVEQAKGQIKKLLNDCGISADDAYVDDFIVDPVVLNAREGLVSVYYAAENYILPAFETTMKKGGKSVKHLDDGIKKIMTATKGSFPEKSKLDNAVDEIVRAEELGDPAAKAFIESADEVMKKLGVDESDSLAKAAILSRSLKGTGFTARAIDPTTRRGKVTIALGLGVIGAAVYDYMIDMRDPSECGMNMMCLYGRSWPAAFSAGMKKQAQMSPETEKLWIELRGSEEGGPLYLASPCKADIVVEYSECECEEFYDTAKIHTDFVIQEWGLKPEICFFGVPMMCITYDIIDTFNVPIDFPHEFKYTEGESITFDYIPEGEEKGMVKTLKNGNMIDSPVMLEQALRGMERDESKDIDELEDWVSINTNGEKRLEKEENKFTFTHMINHNLEQGTLYKNCIKGDWWAFWKEKKDVPCVKIYASAGYPDDYEHNFCYEKKWDSASKAEVGIFAVEIVAGVAAAALATPETLGAGAWPAYCAASMGVSAAGAWVLSDTMAKDKWPDGIN